MNEKKKSILLVGMALIISLFLTLVAVYLYWNLKPESDMVFRVIQNVTYLLMLLTTFVFMKLSKKPFREFGLFKNNISKQVVSGLVIVAVVIVLAALTGWRPSMKEEFLYLALSQALVAFSEELLFRGFVLTMLKDVVSTTNRAMLLAALLFGLWHYPLGQNIGQVITTFIIGAIFGALRTVFENTDSEIGIPSLAFVHWVFNVVL